MTFHVEDQATQFTCAECGGPVVLRIEKFDSWQRRGVVRSRTHVCSEESGHAIGDLVVHPKSE